MSVANRKQAVGTMTSKIRGRYSLALSTGFHVVSRIQKYHGMVTSLFFRNWATRWFCTLGRVSHLYGASRALGLCSTCLRLIRLRHICIFLARARLRAPKPGHESTICLRVFLAPKKSEKSPKAAGPGLAP
jgi:hypothetical protein